MRLVLVESSRGFDAIQKPLIEEIRHVIININEKIKIRGASTIRNLIQTGIMNKGWSAEIFVDPTSRISITSCKMNIGLCIQTGNMARVYADLLKLQTMYVKGLIKGGIIILPTKEAAKVLAANMANMDRLKNELDIFKQVIDIPLVLFGFYE